MGSFSTVMAVLTIQLFYAFAITLIVYSLPAADVAEIAMFQAPTENVNLESVESQIEQSTQSTLDVPIIDLGALAFYSGNIIVDMMLNFLFAIPEMFTLLISAFTLFLPIDPVIVQNVKLFVVVFVGTMYFLGIIKFVMGIRSLGNVV